MIPQILPVTCHTDFIGPGSTFVAIQGMKLNGIDYIEKALQKGATTIVVSQEQSIPSHITSLIEHYGSKLVHVANTRRALAQLSAQAFNYPAKRLKIIGITGTKGKTTTAFLVEHILAHAGYKTALLSTVYNKILDQQFPTHLTTQQPDYLHMFFDQCLKKSIDYVVMEVAAQAYTLERVHGIEFDGFIFTNFSQEHGEFYADINDYFQAKKSLLDQNKTNCPVIINSDDTWCKAFISKNATSISQETQSDYFFSNFNSTHEQSTFIINYKKKSIPLKSTLLGQFNAYNITMAFAVCHQLGLPDNQIINALEQKYIYIPGRLERYILPNNATCVIDYAHNPSSYQSVLSMLTTLTDNLIVVCGAGGDRDKTKRPIMGNLASQFAQKLILTSDNPRSEEPQAIIDDIISGIESKNLNKVAIELDRERAIKKAYNLSTPTSIIALLGKGPDQYQHIKEEKHYFSEKEIIKSL